MIEPFPFAGLQATVVANTDKLLALSRAQFVGREAEVYYRTKPGTRGDVRQGAIAAVDFIDNEVQFLVMVYRRGTATPLNSYPLTRSYWPWRKITILK